MRPAQPEGRRSLKGRFWKKPRRCRCGPLLCRLHQLRAAEQRITDLEAEVERHRDRVERAEQWLRKVYSEIEDRFIRDSGRARTMAR